jgi:hypothetical protein
VFLKDRIRTPEDADRSVSVLMLEGGVAAFKGW